MQQAFETLLSIQVTVAVSPSFSLALPRSPRLPAQTSIVWPANSNHVWQASKISCQVVAVK